MGQVLFALAPLPTLAGAPEPSVTAQRHLEYLSAQDLRTHLYRSYLHADMETPAPGTPPSLLRVDGR